MRKNVKRIALIACIAAILALAACASDTRPSNPTSTDSNANSESSQNNDQSNTTQSLWDLGIDTISLDDTPITAETFKDNTLTVINVWATWCPPCIRELPHLQEVSVRVADDKVQIVGLLKDGVMDSGALDAEAIESAKTLLADAQASYLVILPDETLYTQILANTYSYPTTYFIDSKGEIVHKVSGAKDADTWEEIIHEVLAGL